MHLSRTFRRAPLFVGLWLAAAGCDGSDLLPDASTRLDGGTPADGSHLDGSRDARAADGSAADGGTFSESNDPPVAHDETFYTTVGLELTTGDVLANDTDADGDALEIAAWDPPEHGELVVLTPRTFRYTPEPSYYGEDVFTYRVSDGRGLEDTATVRLHVARTLFYVSSTGSDTNTGTSPTTAWQSLERVQTAVWSHTIRAGDAVLFERGGTYRSGSTLDFNTSGEAGRPTTLGAYGVGEAPVISGSRLVTGWTRGAGEVWRAHLSGAVGQVFVSGAAQTLARQPNEGYLRNDSGTRTSLTDAALTEPRDHYEGAILRIRSISWSYDVRRVTSYASSTLHWAQSLSNDIAGDDWGYYLDGLRVFLDTDGEWFHDADVDVLYLRAPGGVDPNTLRVEATGQVGIDTTGVRLSGNYQTLDGVTVEHFVGPSDPSAAVPTFTGTAVALSYLNHHVTVRNCTIRDSYGGLKAYADDVTVEDNSIERTLATAFQGGGARFLVTRNILRDIATTPGYGEDGWGYFGLRLGGTGIVIRHNDLDHIGYIAMVLNGARTAFQVFDLAVDSVMEENVIRHAVDILNDGGGLSFDMVDRLTVRRNLVFDGVGNLDSQATHSLSLPTHEIGFGIYFGDKAISNTLVEENTSAWNVSGVFVDHSERSHGNVIRGNTFFENEMQVRFSDQSTYQDRTGSDLCIPSFDDVLTDNLLFTESDTRGLLFVQDVQCGTNVRWGTFDRNRYYGVGATSVVGRQCFRFTCTTSFTLPEWQVESGFDGASRAFTGAWRPSASTHAELIYNPYRSPRVVAFSGTRRDPEGEVVTSPVVLAPFTSRILLP